MDKIQRYRLEYGYGSLKQEMAQTLEPVSDNDYIKVSDLKAAIEKRVAAIDDELTGLAIKGRPARYININARKDELLSILAAIGEGK